MVRALLFLSVGAFGVGLSLTPRSSDGRGVSLAEAALVVGGQGTCTWGTNSTGTTCSQSAVCCSHGKDIGWCESLATPVPYAQGTGTSQLGSQILCVGCTGGRDCQSGTFHPAACGT